MPYGMGWYGTACGDPCEYKAELRSCNQRGHNQLHGKNAIDLRLWCVGGEFQTQIGKLCNNSTPRLPDKAILYDSILQSDELLESRKSWTCSHHISC